MIVLDAFRTCTVHYRKMSGLSFTGKVVLVTGASSTVGSELAKYFSKLGASLALTDCDKYRLNRVGDECSGSPVLKIAADLTKNDDITSVIKQTIAEFKKLDVVINIVVPVNSFTTEDQTSFDAFKFMLNVSVCSVYCLTQLAYPHLVKTRGNVINVHGLLSPSTSNLLSCNVSRSALDELTRSLASQFTCKGVRVNAVSSSSVESRPENSGKPSDKSAGLRTHLGPEDVAAAVVFLASDLATFIVGANLPVDGGEHLTSVKVLDNPVENNHEKSVIGAARCNVPKSEQIQPDSPTRELSHIDGNIDEHSKRDLHKNELAKQSSATKHDARKSEADKPTTVKHQSSEKINKHAAKNNN